MRPDGPTQRSRRPRRARDEVGVGDDPLLAGLSTPSPYGVRGPNSLPECLTVKRTVSITFRAPPGEVARLDEFRGDRTRTAYIRELIRRASPADDDDGPDHAEALQLLAQSARNGSVTAAVALERALRAEPAPSAPDDELARILRGS